MLSEARTGVSPGGPSGDASEQVLAISTACRGSSGSGRTMTMQVTYTTIED